jgi:hypothetical protein
MARVTAKSVRRQRFQDKRHNRRVVVNKGVRPPTARMFPESSLAVSESIFLTGGIGDFFAVESYFSDEQRHALKTVYYGTRQSQPIIQAFQSLERYKDLRHVIVWGDFTDFFCFFSKQQATSKITKSRTLPPDWDVVADWSILNVFSHVRRGALPYNQSSFVTDTVADLSKFSLPDKYLAIAPYTVNDKRIKTRDFGNGDWNNVIRIMEQRNCTAVVLNTGHDNVPRHTGLIDLSNETTLPEAVEIVKKASGYFGIDSCLSVIASKVHNIPNLQIKTNNQHCLSNQHIYFAPQTGGAYLKTQITYG